MNTVTHQGIREAIRARIVAGEWALGELIPGEVELAAEYDCSRTTVNRALQALSNEGIVERKRKGGTRVRPLPTAQAKLRIPIIREQIEGSGRDYDHRIISRKRIAPHVRIRQQLGIPGLETAAYVETLHLADNLAFAFERRWVNLATVPEFEAADLKELSANEWLVRKVPFSRGEVILTASAADSQLAEMLSTNVGEPLFTMTRATWFEQRPVTAMELFHAPGHEMSFAV